MNSGLSNINSSTIVRSAQRCLAGTLCLTSLLVGALPAAAEVIERPVIDRFIHGQSASEQSASEQSKELGNAQSESLTNGQAVNSQSVNGQSIPVAQAEDSSSAEPLPALPPAQTPAAESTPRTLPSLGLPAAAPPTQVIEQKPTAPPGEVPSLPPQSAPRYETPLVIPGTEVTPSVLQPAFDDYHLGPGDSIFVSVQRYGELSFQATLDLQGNIILPIQGAVSFEGLTLAEAEEKIYNIYNQYVVLNQPRDPRDISLTLVAQRGVEVTILGSVQRPGFYPLSDPTVATALLTAGGATRTSDLRSIQVQRQFRRNGGIVEETVDVDLFTPLKEGSPLPDVRLEDGDVVIIPELDPSQLDEYDRYLVARSTLAQPIINVRFLNYSGGRSNIGTLNVNNGSDFLDAISLLGVSPDTANLGDVALIRYDPETGRAVPVSLDAKSAIEGDITQNPPLEDSDVIIVGRNLVGRLTYALQTVTRPFRDVLSFTRFFDDFLDSTPFNNN